MNSQNEGFTPSCIELIHEEDEWKVFVNTTDNFIFCNDNELIDEIEKLFQNKSELYNQGLAENKIINFDKQFFTYRDLVLILVDFFKKNANIHTQNSKIIDQQIQKFESDNKKLNQLLQESHIQYEVLSQEKQNEINLKCSEHQEKIRMLQSKNNTLQDQNEKFRKQLLDFHVKYDTLVSEQYNKSIDTHRYSSIEKKYQGSLKNYDELKDNYNKIYDQYKDCIIQIKQHQEMINLSTNKISILEHQKNEQQSKINELEQSLTQYTSNYTPRPNLNELFEVAALYNFDTQQSNLNTNQKIQQVIKNIKMVREVNNKSKVILDNNIENKVSKQSSISHSPYVKSQKYAGRRNKSINNRNINQQTKHNDLQQQKSKNNLSLSNISNESFYNSALNEDKEYQKMIQQNNNNFRDEYNNMQPQDNSSLIFYDEQGNIQKSIKNTNELGNKHYKLKKQKQNNNLDTSNRKTSQSNNSNSEQNNSNILWDKSFDLNNQSKSNKQEQFLKYIKISHQNKLQNI